MLSIVKEVMGKAYGYSSEPIIGFKDEGYFLGTERLLSRPIGLPQHGNGTLMPVGMPELSHPPWRDPLDKG
jgi:hypothetical protein